MTWIVLLPLAVTLLSGCGGGGGDDSAAGPDVVRPVAQSVQLDEDTVHSGTLSTDDATGLATFHVSSPPAHGSLDLVATTGAFAYTPAADYFGTDSFAYSVLAANGSSAPATLTLNVTGVDDPPAISGLPDTGNSPDHYEVVLPLAIQHVDDELLEITASAADTAVVQAVVDQPARRLILRPGRRGTSRVEVRVNDGNTTVAAGFTFTVDDVTREVQVATSAPGSHAVLLTNTGSQATDFELMHNGRLAFTSMDQILDAIRTQPDEVPAEPFERKLWRFLRDNTLHHAPVSGAGWMDGTWPTLNSFGWGFCSNVTSAFLQIAAAAGLEARAWGLGGHIVPEIRVGDHWQVYDPDVAIYYFRRGGGIASVADLAADRGLIMAPVNSLFAPGEYGYASGYDPFLADVYGTTGDNYVDPWYPSAEPYHGSRIVLPAGGRLIYPGRWTDGPTGYDGVTPHPVGQFRQARLEVAAGTTGALTIPWVLWDVQGAGTVRIRDQDHAAGSAELSNLLAGASASVTEIEILDNPGGIALVMMINPLWYDMLASNDLRLTGKDVWAIQAGSEFLPADNRPPPPVPAAVRKPVPTN